MGNAALTGLPWVICRKAGLFNFSCYHCPLCLRQPKFAGSFSFALSYHRTKGCGGGYTSVPCWGGLDGASHHVAHPKVCLAPPFPLTETGSELRRAQAAVRIQQHRIQQLSCVSMAAKHTAQSWPALPYPILQAHSITHSAGKGLGEHPRVDILHISGSLYHPGTGLLLTVKSELPETVSGCRPLL